MNYNEDEYGGINGFVMPLFYMDMSFADLCRYLTMQKPGLGYQKAPAACGARRKKRQDTHTVQPPLARVNLPQIKECYV